MATEAIPVHMVTLGCARNEVDSEELAARLAAGGFRLVGDPGVAEAVLVNTCGFISAAKKDSVDTLLAASDLKQNGHAKAVIAVGCMAERYGVELAQALPEADAVLGFDAYPDIADRVRSLLAGDRPASHVPTDRRRLLPISPVARPAAVHVPTPGHATVGGPADGRRPGPPVLRRRLDDSATAPLKIASGCDRRCAFCAIPSFRGSYLSRPVDDIVAEARWLVDQGVREVLLVSENTSSYGKDLAIAHPLETLLDALSGVDGLDWIRLSYLQPAEVRPSLITAVASIEKVVAYFDMPVQHASATVLRRMRRFGDADAFLGLIEAIRASMPTAGIRTNVICGFPGETEADVEILADFLAAAQFDAVGVFGYSDEEGTEGAGLDLHVDEDEIEARRERIFDLADVLMEQRALDRIGQDVDVLLEERTEDGWQGRSAHQGPEVDGATILTDAGPDASAGTIVRAVVQDTHGVDIVATRTGG